MTFLSFNNMGRIGRLGNQMFQYAALVGISEANNKKAAADLSNTHLENGFKMGGNVKDCYLHSEKIITEPGFNFDDRLLNLEKYIPNFKEQNFDLVGYFQTEKYFKHVEKMIKKQFSFTESIQNESMKVFQNLGISSEECVSVHVRRGDYLVNEDKHPIQPKEYYMNSMDMFSDKTPIFFSDDIDWCKENFTDKKYLFTQNNKFVDMCAMSMCSSHIITNSSFSWWASWLSGKKTIAPSMWFNPNCNIKNWSDVYVDSWLVL